MKNVKINIIFLITLGLIFNNSLWAVYEAHWGISDAVVKNEVNPLIKKIAKDKNLHFIDLYTPFLGKGKLFPYHIHPNAEGAGEMAEIIYTKVSLEGVSRGGLFVFNWVKQNPDKVNSIYAEAPVCDIMSWPAGFGDGKGSAADWQRLKDEYGFKTDEEAKAKVPVLHMIGLDDGVVPIDENSLKLVNRYIKLGGIAKIVPCTEGKQDLWGHHFEIETPRLGTDYNENYTGLPKQKLKSSDYHVMRSGLENSYIMFEQQKKARVAFLGGSITYNGGWRDSIYNYLQNRFPKVEFEFIAAGIPSFGSTEDAFRLKRDVLMNGPVGLLFVEAAVNDGRKGKLEEEIMRSMEGIVRHTRENDPTTDIVFMYFADSAKIADYKQDKAPQVIQNHDEVAAYYNIPAINLAQEVAERIDAGEFTWNDDFQNLHPSPFGQGIYAHSMITFLNNAWSGFVAEDDKITNYSIPEKLDDACYDSGVLISAKIVELQKGWMYVENWIPEIEARTRKNYINVPMLVGNYPGKALKLKFDGTAVGIAVSAGPDAGIIEFRIDDGKWKQQDLFTKHSAHFHLPWYFTLADGLMPGGHVLQFRLIGEKNKNSIGNSCVLRYFYVNK